MASDYGGLSLLLDVGANVGDWSDHALAYAKAADAEIRIIAFEPRSTTHQTLRERFRSEPRIETCQLALSSYIGEATFFSGGDGSGTNSLNPISGPTTETVGVMTLDDFMARRGIERVTLPKIDTEGYDLNVLQGALSALR